MTTLTWGVLGTAGINERMVPALQKAGTVRAIASRTESRAEAEARRFGIAQAYGSYEALLADPQIEAVYIPLPNSLHAAWSVAALRAGKHVLCEKPLAPTLAAVRAMIDAADEAECLLQEAYMYAHHPLYAELRRLLAAGTIGRVRGLRAGFSFLCDDPKSIVLKPELAGGALLDVGGYPLHAARLLLGAEPEEITALWHVEAVDLSVAAVLRFPGDVLVELSAAIDRAECHRLEVDGETGRLVVSNPWHPGAEEAIRVSRHGEADRLIPVLGGDPYVLQAETFARHVAQPAAWPALFEDAVRQATAIEAIRRAALAG